MTRPMKLTLEQLEEIKKLYREGKNFSELGRQFGCDHTTIMYHLGKTKKSRLQKRTSIRAYKKEINPTYGYNLNTLSKKSNSQYADYLAKYLAKQKKQDLSISVLFANKIKK